MRDLVRIESDRTGNL